MSHRLTVAEFEFLKKSLQWQEKALQAAIMVDHQKLDDAFFDFAGYDKAGHVESAEKTRLLREKIQYIAGE